MENRYSVKLGKLIEEFDLEVLRGAENYQDVLIQREDVNRPGLQLVGFFDYFDAKRMQLLAYHRDKAPYAVLVEAVKDGGPGLEILPVHYQTQA